MNTENDYLLTRLTARIDNVATGLPIGSGIVVSSPDFNDSVYLLTAAHCLYEDGEQMKQPMPEVSINLFDPVYSAYQSISVPINHDLVSKSPDKDIAVIKLSKAEVEAITTSLPIVHAIKERHSVTSFRLKGFPSATKGQELVLTEPEFVQELTAQGVFQLRLVDDFTTATSAESKVDGFSGSGVFLEDHNKLYLFGIFARFRDAQKIIYCQYIEAANDLLTRSFLPTIPFAYIGEHGLTPDFFAKHNKTAVENLGPRFSSKLNLRLPIILDFHDAAKDSNFRQRLSGWIDNWLLHSAHNGTGKKDNVLENVSKELGALKQSTIEWFSAMQWNADRPIDLEWLLEGLSTLDRSIDEKQKELYELQWQERQSKKGQEVEKEKISYSRQEEPYENELRWLRETERAIYTFKRELKGSSISLANSPLLVIKGEPGCGKSHLLGDMVSRAMKAGAASLLFLGQHFKSTQTIWQNILGQLDLSCTKEELLTSLNSIGKQQGVRVLIMIDALNEGPGKDLWKDALAGFVEEVLRYPFVGIVFTVRTTYFNAVIPENLRTDERLTFRVHEGFKGNEYEALKLFCEHYGLQTPNFPILAPEFSNPLFLQLICQSIKASGKKIFPQGFQGVTKIFNYYIEAIYQKLSDKSNGVYENRRHVVRNAIYAVAKACFEKEGARMLTVEEAICLIDNEFPSFPNLLNDLIHENVFIQTTQTDYETSEELEMLYFAYERLGDFFITEQLLDKYATPVEVKEACLKEGELGKLWDDSYWRNRGILEAMAVRLPEKYNLEIVEVFGWVSAESNDRLYFDVDEWLSGFQWDSLKWRTPSSIDDNKITTWLNGDRCKLRDEEYFLRLVELTTVHDHPFNGDRLCKFLNQFSMPERDGFWQAHVRYYSGDTDDGNAFPIKRLIDWAWGKGVSMLVDSETARLAGQTLAWLLASTVRHLRDQATKAMVNLLEEQPDSLIRIMESFQDTDDAYIAERLYAVAYGCALRTSSDAYLKKIAVYIYESTFKKRNPPVHVLLRDYARNTIEYAHYKGLVEQVDMVAVRPPYHSKFPKLPTKDDVKRYESKITGTTDALTKKSDWMYGQIYNSTVGWDFGRYTVSSAVSDFTPISFMDEAEFKAFKRRFRGDKRDWIKVIESSLELQASFKGKKVNGAISMANRPMEQWISEVTSLYEGAMRALQNSLRSEEFQEFHLKFIPFLRTKFAAKKYPHDSFGAEAIKYWIVQRAFELGYDVDKHAQYDSSVDSYSRHENAVERVGKKYQWIALHEIVARLGDNYYFKEDRWNGEEKYAYYQGPWQHYLRDIDPVFIAKNQKKSNDNEIDSLNQDVDKGWWLDADYKYWDQSPQFWADNRYDLPTPENIISRRDANGEAWVYLKLYASWDEPKAVGEERYGRDRKQIYYLVNAYLIQKKDKTRTLKWLTGKNFFGRWMPENNSVNLSLFNRENYWSPASAFDQKYRKAWETIRDSKLKVIVTTSEAVGEMSKDKSDAHLRYNMPSRTLFEGMGLTYAPDDGSFVNSSGETVVTNVNPDGVLIRMKDLLAFLEQNNYEIIWTLLGEKMAISGSRDENHFRAISGVYHYHGSKVVGDFFISNRGED